MDKKGGKNDFLAFTFIGKGMQKTEDSKIVTLKKMKLLFKCLNQFFTNYSCLLGGFGFKSMNDGGLEKLC